MTVANVLKELAGIFPSDAGQLATDMPDVFSDEVILIPMLLDGAAGTDYTYGSFKAQWAFQVIEAVICPSAVMTGATATANTYTLGKADGAGGASTVIGTFVSITGADFAADVFKALTLSATPANVLVARGQIGDGRQIVTFKKTHASTGTVTPQSTLYLKVRKI